MCEMCIKRAAEYKAVQADNDAMYAGRAGFTPFSNPNPFWRPDQKRPLPFTMPGVNPTLDPDEDDGEPYAPMPPKRVIDLTDPETGKARTYADVMNDIRKEIAARNAEIEAEREAASAQGKADPLRQLFASVKAGIEASSERATRRYADEMGLPFEEVRARAEEMGKRYAAAVTAGTLTPGDAIKAIWDETRKVRADDLILKKARFDNMVREQARLDAGRATVDATAFDGLTGGEIEAEFNRQGFVKVYEANFSRADLDKLAGLDFEVNEVGAGDYAAVDNTGIFYKASDLDTDVPQRKPRAWTPVTDDDDDDDLADDDDNSYSATLDRLLYRLDTAYWNVLDTLTAPFRRFSRNHPKVDRRQYAAEMRYVASIYFADTAKNVVNLIAGRKLYND